MRNVVQLCLAANNILLMSNSPFVVALAWKWHITLITSQRYSKNKLGDPMIMICLPPTIHDIFAQPPPMIVNYFDIFVGTATHREDKVASISKEGVKPGNTLVSQLQLPVPSLSQTMQSCSCMKISYFLRVIYSISVHGDLWEKSSLCDVLN